MQNSRLKESQDGIKKAGRNINNLIYADDTTLMAEIEVELNSLFMRVRGEWKSGLKLNIQKTKIMASGPITSWQIGKEKVETEPDFVFLGYKITVNVDCRLEIKSNLLLGRKAMKSLHRVLKSRDITLLTKVRTPASPQWGTRIKWDQQHINKTTSSILPDSLGPHG